MAAEQLGIVALELIFKKAVNHEQDKMSKLKNAIENFHNQLQGEEDQSNASFKNVLEEAERQQLDKPEVKKWLDRVKDAYYEVVDACDDDACDELQAQEKMRKGKQSFALSSCLDHVKEPFQKRDRTSQTSNGADALLTKKDKHLEQRKGKQPFVLSSCLDRVKESFHSCSSQKRDGTSQTSNGADALSTKEDKNLEQRKGKQHFVLSSCLDCVKEPFRCFSNKKRDETLQTSNEADALSTKEDKHLEQRKGKQPFVLPSCLDRVKEPFRCCNNQKHNGTLQTSNEADALSTKKDKQLEQDKCQVCKILDDLSKERVILTPKPKGKVLQGTSNATFMHNKDKDERLYGRDDEKRSIVARMNHVHKDAKLVTILGEAGIGKTALARQIYEEVKAGFDTPAWVNVSDEFNKRRIARYFVEGVTKKTINNNELDNVDQRVRDIIRGKRFLLVLDGVQNQRDFHFKWRELMNVFKGGGPGCTILMTTCQENLVVARAPESFYKKSLRPLTDDDCRSIIHDQAFGTDPKLSVNIDKQIQDSLVGKCEGLPVIAKALGSILRDKITDGDWEKVSKSDIWDTDSYSKDKPRAVKATMLSYYSLPSHLRQCLLYCAIFPKRDYIDVNKLLSLWMAQDSFGFDQEYMEAEAWKRFKQLQNCSVFPEYFKQDDSGNFVCKLQSAMSDFIQDLARNECHIMTLDKTERNKEVLPDNTRHCTLNVLTQASLPESIPGSEKLHTLKLLSEFSSTDPDTLSDLLRKMGRLRALDLSYCSLNKLPVMTCELLHLRYLDLSFNRDLSSLPKSICSLFNLQTLNLNGCDDLQELPPSIGDLINLRHLDILWTTSLSYLPKDLARLTSLRRLSRFFGPAAADRKAKAYCSLGDLKDLNKLQGSISIEGLEAGASDEAKNANLKGKKDLYGLELWFSVLGSDSHEKVLENLEPPPQLESLGIFYYRGSFTSFPSWWTKLEKLTHVILCDCTKCDTLPPLGKLQSLQSLEIRNFPNVKVVGVEFLGHESISGEWKNAFRKLEKLHFEKLENWETWHAIGDDRDVHMPSLSSLSILSCPKLESVPKYIKARKKSLEKNQKIQPHDLFKLIKKVHADKEKEKEKGA